MYLALLSRIVYQIAHRLWARRRPFSIYLGRKCGKAWKYLDFMDYAGNREKSSWKGIASAPSMEMNKVLFFMFLWGITLG